MYRVILQERLSAIFPLIILIYSNSDFRIKTKVGNFWVMKCKYTKVGSFIVIKNGFTKKNKMYE